LHTAARAGEEGAKYLDQITGLFRKYKMFPDEGAYATLISAYAHQNLVDKAFSAFDEMKRLAINPTEKSYQSLITACKVSKDCNKAYEIFEEMLKYDIKPDSVFYRNILNLFKEHERGDLLHKIRPFAKSFKATTLASEGPSDQYLKIKSEALEERRLKKLEKFKTFDTTSKDLLPTPAEFRK